MSFENVTHCIFDMDGLLINTETIYTAVTNNVLARYGTRLVFIYLKLIIELKSYSLQLNAS